MTVTGSIPPRGPRRAESVTIVFPVGRSDSLSPSHESFSGGVESAELQRRLEPREEGAEKEEPWLQAERWRQQKQNRNWLVRWWTRTPQNDGETQKPLYGSVTLHCKYNLMIPWRSEMWSFTRAHRCKYIYRCVPVNLNYAVTEINFTQALHWITIQKVLLLSKWSFFKWDQVWST